MSPPQMPTEDDTSLTMITPCPLDGVVNAVTLEREQDPVKHDARQPETTTR